MFDYSFFYNLLSTIGQYLTPSIKTHSAQDKLVIVGSVVEWLERHDCDRHGLGSKPSRAILLSRERHFTAFSLFGGLGEQF